MIYGYARVSTQDLESQLQALQAEGAQGIYEEKFTGTQMDRLARNTKEGIDIIEQLFARNVKVHVLNVGLLENTTMGRFFLQTLLAVAEMERNIIIERTQEGKAIAKQREGYREGRPKKYTNVQLNHAMKLKESHSFKQVAEMTGISVATLKRESRSKRENQR